MADSQLNAVMSLVSLSIQRCFKWLGVLYSRVSPSDAECCWGYSGLIQTWGFTKDLSYHSTVIHNECMMCLKKEMSFSWTNFSNHINKYREKAGGYIIIVLYNKKRASPVWKVPSSAHQIWLPGKVIKGAKYSLRLSALNPVSVFPWTIFF